MNDWIDELMKTAEVKEAVYLFIYFPSLIRELSVHNFAFWHKLVILTLFTSQFRSCCWHLHCPLLRMCIVCNEHKVSSALKRVKLLQQTWRCSGRFNTNADISTPELFPFKGLSSRQCVMGVDTVGKEWITYLYCILYLYKERKRVFSRFCAL